MRIVTSLALGAVCILFALPAEALTISNSDAKPHTITVKSGTDSSEMTIAPQQSVQPACQSGCTIELENGDIYELKGEEEASIDTGALFLDVVPNVEGGEMTGATGEAPKAE